MSSREIAELTGKRHDNVKTDIEKMLLELELNVPEFSGTYIATNGNISIEFNLPKRESLILVSGYSIVLRAKIIDRWQELESQQQSKIPQTYAEALQLAADQAKQIEILALDNKETKQERNAAINTINKLGDVLHYQARVLEARDEDRAEIRKQYERRSRR